jgi:hypothetical protein
MAVETCEALEVTDKATGTPGAAADSDKLTPAMAPVTVLLALVMGTPSTVSWALAPATDWVKPKLGSLIVNGVVPSVLVRDRLVPWASLPAVAVTPRFWALILAARVA